MTTEAVLIKAENDDCVADVLDRAAGQLDAAGGELALDFSSVARIDSRGVQALENLVAIAGEKAVKVGLRGVNVGVYKVLKLMRLAHRLSFVD